MNKCCLIFSKKFAHQLFGTFLLTVCLTLHSLAQTQNRTGFYYPAGTQNQGGYEGWMAYNQAFSGYHVARDFQKNVGDQIVAVSDGDVVFSEGNVAGFGGDRNPRGAVVIRHYAKEGNNVVAFYALYGHLSTRIPNNSHVLAGQAVGTIGHYFSSKYGDIPHLHFGIHPYTIAANQTEGYTKNRNNTDGWVDPIAWMDSHSPSNKDANNSSSAPIASQNMSNGDLNCYFLGRGNFLLELFQVGAPYPSRQTGPVKSLFMYRAQWDNLVRSQHYFIRATNKNDGKARQTQSFLLDPSKDRCVIAVNWDNSNFLMNTEALTLDK